VAGRGGNTLLDCDGSGWRPIALPEGLDLTDFALDGETATLWLAGTRDGASVTLQQPVTGGVPHSSESHAHDESEEHGAPTPIAAAGQVNVAKKGIGA
jgi:hypothetical protein